MHEDPPKGGDMGMRGYWRLGHSSGIGSAQSLLRCRWALICAICLAIAAYLGGECAAGQEDLPRCLVYLPTHRTTHAIVVEKSTARLLLYRRDPQGLHLVKEFACSLGKVKGEKTRDGDKKTPSGIFWLEEDIPQDKLPQRYGAGALVLNYPNFFDRSEGRGGNGIWIHGTNLPERLRTPRDTDGCIVLDNQDFLEIRQVVRLLETPVIVQSKITYEDPREWRIQRKIMLERLRGWLDTWTSDGHGLSGSLYSERFRSDPKGAAHFLEVRRTLARGQSPSRTRIGDLFFLRDRNEAAAMFILERRAESGSSQWKKAVYWTLEGDLWKIVGEEVLDRAVEPTNPVMGRNPAS